MKTGLAALACLWALGCAPTQGPKADTAVIQTDEAPSALSCAVDTQRYDGSPIVINATPVPLGKDTDIAKALPQNVKFRGGWHLTSTNPEFGGLSGLAVLSTGHLFAVSDRGYAVTLGFSSDDDTPTGVGTLTPLLNADGKALSGKTAGDAEGVAYADDGLTFISFEREHRILAYDFERCGVAAKGIPFAGLPKAKLGARIAPNDGAEALDFHPDGRVRAGYETVINGRAPIVTFDMDGTARDAPEFIDVEESFKLVGADSGFRLFRAYDRELGNRNIVTSRDVSFRLTPPLNVDNFEGIAARAKPDGSSTIYLVSDDNFSARQRTLLYVFEMSP